METPEEDKPISSRDTASEAGGASFLPQFFFETLPEEASLVCVLPPSTAPSSTIMTLSSSNTNHGQSTNMTPLGSSSSTTSTSNQVKRNRSSASAIPRPTSGTSRRETPSLARFRNAGSLPPAQTFHKVPHLHRKSWHPSDTCHISSLSLPVSASSNSSLPSYMTKSPTTTSLPKSRTLGSLLASSREVTPSGRLMQPIQPPLPRSQTLGNISCFGNPALTPSPRKPTQAISDCSRSYYISPTQLDGSKAFQGSRMTEKEIRLTKDIQREAATTRTRMRNALSKAPVKLRTPAPLKPRISHIPASGDMPLSSVPSIGRAAPRELSAFHLPGATFRNQSLESHFTTRMSETADRLNHLPCTPSSRQDALNPKDVYNAESIAYWTGRFVGLCDRLKTEEYSTKRSFSGPPTNKSADAIWDSKDKMLVDTALIELICHCKSTEALQSLAKFKNRLVQDVGRNRNNATAQLPGHIDLPKPCGLYSNNIWIAPSPPETATSTTSQVSSANAEESLAVGPSLFYGRGGIIKSKTTGHLASLIPLIQARSRSIAPTTSQTPEASTAEASNHRRKTSYFDCSPETRAQALRERADRAARRVAEVRRRSEGRQLSNGKIPISETNPLINPTLTQNQKQGQTCSSGTTAPGMDSGASNIGVSARVKNEVISSLRSAPVMSSNVEVNSRPNRLDDGEKGRRKASGEIMKNLFGVGIREMRKMGRRVGGGRAWSGSHEELPLSSNK